MVEIKYVPYGIANNFGDYIELNEHLPEWKELHDAILTHELQHTDEPGFTKKDFLLDLAPTKINYWTLFRFMCIYPKTFLQFAPFYFQKGKFIYDINLSIVWAVLIAIITMSIIIASKL
jgi:hypothetical protein